MDAGTGKTLRWPDAVDGYFAWLGPKKLSPNTLKAYRNDLTVIIDLVADEAGCLPAEITVEDLTRDTLRVAFSRFAAGHSKASISRAHSTWSHLFAWLVADDHVPGSPMAAVALPRPDPRSPKPLAGWGDDTVPRLLAAARRGVGRSPWPERDVAVVAALLATGLRQSEFLGLTLGSFEGPAGQRVVRVVGKGNKARAVPVERPLEELLDGYLQSRQDRFTAWRPTRTDPFWVATPPHRRTAETVRTGGQALTPGKLDYLIGQILAEAGCGGRKPDGALTHAFRHTFGTMLAAAGAKAEEIRRLMGHSSIATSQGYIDSLAREQRRAAAASLVYDAIVDLEA